MQYKNYTIPDHEIDKLMESLDISITEACEIYLSDHEIVKNEVVEELTSKAKKNKVTNTIHGAKGEKKERKAREKKENPLKKEIIEELFYGLTRNLLYSDCINIRNDEKYIDFTIEGRDFTVNLVEHRKKKEE